MTRCACAHAPDARESASFARVWTAVNIGAAYARYRRYRGLWAPGVAMQRVAAAPVVPMLELAEALRSGGYRPAPAQRISIAKGNGERRELRVFAIRDRVAQRALLQVLQARTDAQMAPGSFGYRPGRGVLGALARVRTLLDAGLSWVLDADIERCFDSIPRAPLLEEVARRLDSPEAAELVAVCLGWESRGQRAGVGIPQGAVIAPWLCNIYLWPLDEAMQAQHAPMVRFADDFVVLTAARACAESVQRRCAQVVEHMRLRLHPGKTAIIDGARPFRFLGQWLRTTPRLTCAAPAAGA